MAISSYKKVATAESKINIYLQGKIVRLSFWLVSTLVFASLSVGVLLGSEKTFNLGSKLVAVIAVAAERGDLTLTASVSGEDIKYAAAEHVEMEVFREAIDRLIWVFPIGLLVAIIITYLLGRYIVFGAFGGGVESFVRGGVLGQHEQVKAILKERSKGESLPFEFEGIPIPKEFETRHFAFSGDTGVGKSQQIIAMMNVVRARGKKALVYDKSGELTEHFYREGKDIILNPLDDRCAGWSIFNEGEEIYEYEAIAESLIPTKGSDESGNGSHWTEAARSVFVWLLSRLKKELGRNPEIDELLQTLIDSKTEVEKNALGEDVIVRKRELDRIIKGSLASMVVNPDSPEHASGVISTLVPKIRSLWYLRGLEKKKRFSLTEWIQDENDDSWVFVRVNDKQLTSVKPLITAWLDLTVSAVLGLRKSRTREIFCFIDELQSLDKLSSLERGLFEARKYGMRFVLGFTSAAALFQLYGEKTFKAMFSMCGTKLFFRVSEPDLADWASKTLLEKEVITEKSSLQAGTRNESTGLNEQRENLRLVSKDELTLLDDLMFYLRCPGNIPTTLVKGKYRSYPVIAEAFKERKLPEETNYASDDDYDDEGEELEEMTSEANDEYTMRSQGRLL